MAGIRNESFYLGGCFDHEGHLLHREPRSWLCSYPVDSCVGRSDMHWGTGVGFPILHSILITMLECVCTIDSRAGGSAVCDE